MPENYFDDRATLKIILNVVRKLFWRSGDVLIYFKRRPNVISSFGRRLKRVKYAPDVPDVNFYCVSWFALPPR